MCSPRGTSFASRASVWIWRRHHVGESSVEANADETSDARECQTESAVNKGESVPVLKENEEEIAYLHREKIRENEEHDYCVFNLWKIQSVCARYKALVQFTRRSYGDCDTDGDRML